MRPRYFLLLLTLFGIGFFSIRFGFLLFLTFFGFDFGGFKRVRPQRTRNSMAAMNK